MTTEVAITNPPWNVFQGKTTMSVMTVEVSSEFKFKMFKLAKTPRCYLAVSV